LSEIEPAEIAMHMSDPRVAEQIPILTSNRTAEVAGAFVAAKEEC